MLRTRTDLTTDTVRLNALSTAEFASNLAELVWPSREVFWHPRAAVLLPLNIWQEAAAGVPLIHFPTNAVLLATRKESLPRATRDELLRLRPPGIGTNGERLPAQVFLVGSISSSVVQAVRKLGFTTMRIGGDNSLDTAAAIAREMARDRPDPPTILVPYNSPIDSQPVVALAAHSRAPILFVNFASIPEETASALLDINPSAVYLLGRDSQISVTMVSKINALLPAARVTRVGGESITDFSVNLARFLDPANGFGWGRTERDGAAFTFVATGNIYQSVFSATLAHLATHAPELIIPSGQHLPGVLKDYLTSLNPPLFNPPRPPFMRAWIIGDRTDISVAQQVELESLIIKEQGDWPPPMSD